MKRKKVIALFAVLIMAIGALGGCNGQEKSDQNKQESKVETDTKTGDKPYDGVKLTMHILAKPPRRSVVSGRSIIHTGMTLTVPFAMC